MSKVMGVLLVPAEGDPLGLLKCGPCGFRPPFAKNTSRGWFGGHQRPPDIYIEVATALVLAWDGEVVGAGVDHAHRQLPRALDLTWGHFAYAALQDVDEDLHDWLAVLAHEGHHVVLLDAQGREVTP